MELRVTIASILRRINRKLAKFIPSGQLIWDYKEQNYFLHVYEEPRRIIGPVYHKDLLPFATYINLWKVHERPLYKLLITSHGPEQEGKLRSDLHVQFHTLFEHAYLEKKFPGRPAEKIFLITEPVTEEDNVPEEVRQAEWLWAENDAPQAPAAVGINHERVTDDQEDDLAAGRL